MVGPSQTPLVKSPIRDQAERSYGPSSSAIVATCDSFLNGNPRIRRSFTKSSSPLSVSFLMPMARDPPPRVTS